MILVAGPRYVPSLPYVVFLGVICRSQVVTVYQRATYCEYCQCMGSITMLILIVYYRVQTTEHAPVLTYRQLVFVYHMRRPRGSYTCTSYDTFRCLFARPAKF